MIFITSTEQQKYNALIRRDLKILFFLKVLKTHVFLYRKDRELRKELRD